MPDTNTYTNTDGIKTTVRGYEPSAGGTPDIDKVIGSQGYARPMEYAKNTLDDWKTAVANKIPPLPNLPPFPPKIKFSAIIAAINTKVDGLKNQAIAVKNKLKAEKEKLAPKEPPETPTVDAPTSSTSNSSNT